MNLCMGYKGTLKGNFCMRYRSKLKGNHCMGYKGKLEGNNAWGTWISYKLQLLPSDEAQHLISRSPFVPCCCRKHSRQMFFG